KQVARMPLWLRQSLIPTLILSAMLITLGGLAWLQYGWSAQVSDALQQRMRANLASSVQRFQAAFQQDFSRTCGAFEVGTAVSSAEMKSLLLDSARTWNLSGLPRELVSNVYVVQSDARGDWRAELLDVASGQYTQTAWPARWLDLA